jgi:hypothetical protein
MALTACQGTIFNQLTHLLAILVRQPTRKRFTVRVHPNTGTARETGLEIAGLQGLTILSRMLAVVELTSSTVEDIHFVGLVSVEYPLLAIAAPNAYSRTPTGK